MVSPLVTAAVAGAAVGMVVYHTLNSRLTSATEEAMSESGGGLQTMAERLLQLEGRRSFECTFDTVGPAASNLLTCNRLKANCKRGRRNCTQYQFKD